MTLPCFLHTEIVTASIYRAVTRIYFACQTVLSCVFLEEPKATLFPILLSVDAIGLRARSGAEGGLINWQVRRI